MHAVKVGALEEGGDWFGRSVRLRDNHCWCVGGVR